MSEPIKADNKRKKFGIDDYIVFDKKKGEISMEIPMTLLMNPDENKKIREEIIE